MTTPTLARRLGLGDAIAIGLGSMIGAGVFAVWGPAVRTTPLAWLPLALAIAAFVAFANATSSAQLAAVHPVAGGTYAYGRAELGDWWGHAAGWCFVIGKTASCAAMAMTFAGYVWPSADPMVARAIGVAIVLALTGVNCMGVTRTALLTKVIVTIVLIVLAATLFMHSTSFIRGIEGPAVPVATELTPWGLLQSAALLFFAFAGYARIATMGEEVRDPARVIPRAIVTALGLALAVYLAVALVLGRLYRDAKGVVEGHGYDLVPALPRWPLVYPAEDFHRWLLVPLAIAAASACAGALLNLMTGIGRTTLAMAREDDMPRWLAAVHPRSRVPHRAEILLGVVVAAIVACFDLRSAIGFSSFGVLLYYAVANLAALRQSTGRRYPRVLQVAGAALCVLLVATLPWRVLLTGVAVLAVGLALRPLIQRANQAAARAR